MSKRRLALLSISLLVNYALVACAQLSSSFESRVEFRCLDAIGCVDIPSGGPIHIAYVLAITGPDQSIGIDTLNGIEIAIEDKGQILGHEILLTGEDEGCTPEGGLIASTKIAADQEIIAVIGPSCSDVARMGVSILSQAGLTIVSPSNTHLDLNQLGIENQYPGYARTALNNSVQAKAAAEFAYYVLGTQNVATIHDGTPSTEDLQKVFVEYFQQLGGTITSEETINPHETNYNPVLTRIANSSPELIYYSTLVQAGILISRQARSIPALENTALMGTDRMFSLELVENVGDAVEGLYITGPDSSVFNDSYTSEFIPKYIEMYRTEPIHIYHAHAYDAFMLIANAIEKIAIQDAEGILHIPRQGLRETLYATKDYQGLTGNLSCKPNGDCADGRFAVYQYHSIEFPPDRIWP